jgi:UDP-GlcNAc:undecaprenyl-phosphate/decaprenyl-phosphate GlcNAc-1-phosphate transferase
LHTSIFDYALLIFIPFIGTVILTPLISTFAMKHNFTDKPGQHKIHSKAKPVLGGLAIFACFALTVLLFIPVDSRLFSMAVATFLLITIGIVDDLYGMKPLLKLTGQTAAVAVVVLWDTSLYHVLLDYFARFYLPDFLILAFIIGWIVMMINAFNLIDGLDGLAVGTAAIIFFAMAVLSIFNQVPFNVLALQLIGLGACTGFLIFNFNPAKIYLGDTGSMLLGFILASTHLYTIKYPFSAQLVLGSMFIFAYPAVDISYTIFRRLYKKAPIFQADQGHIHHILLSLGFSIRKTVLLIYLVNILFASIAIILLAINIPTRYLFIIGIITLLLVVFLFKRLLMISRDVGKI